LRLTQIWENLLNVRPIGVTDNFFEIGGHSLLALRLLVEIEQGLGRKMPLMALFEGPTIEHLAAVAWSQERKRPQIVSLWSAEHPLKLFLVHTGGGTVLNYIPLVRHLAAEVPVYGIQANGLDGKNDPHRYIPQMATDYVEKLRRIQPLGPYLLGGHSLGGIIAFEMARQLHESGQRVALLAMFDSILSGSPEDELLQSEPGDTEARILADAAAKIARFTGKDINLPYQELRSLSIEAQIARVLDVLRQSDALPIGEEGAELVRNLVKVSKAHLEARRAYQPGISPVPITLFRARDVRSMDPASPGGDSVNAQSLGWSAASEVPVRILRVPGDHVTMMSEPNVRSLAQSLGLILSEAIQSQGLVDGASRVEIGECVEAPRS